jgi:hypothetical protein
MKRTTPNPMTQRRTSLAKHIGDLRPRVQVNMRLTNANPMAQRKTSLERHIGDVRPMLQVDMRGSIT